MAKSGVFFRKGVVFCHTFFCAVRIFFYFCTNYKVDGHLIVFTCIGETPTSVGLPENGVTGTKKAWGGVSRWWLLLIVSLRNGALL